jgi:hypothetical protein
LGLREAHTLGGVRCLVLGAFAMSTADDLRELCDELDAALTGWPRGGRPYMTTKTGEKAEALLRQLRARRYKQWGENLALRGRLRAALSDIDGLRAANEALTAELERLRGP